MGGYLQHRDLAEAELAPERFFMNVIVPRLQRLYEWSARELGEPRLRELVRDGIPIYAWPFEQRHVWRKPNMPLAARALERVARAR